VLATRCTFVTCSWQSVNRQPVSVQKRNSRGDDGAATWGVVRGGAFGGSKNRSDDAGVPAQLS